MSEKFKIVDQQNFPVGKNLAILFLITVFSSNNQGYIGQSIQEWTK